MTGGTGLVVGRPQTLDDYLRLAEMLAKSDLVPKEFKDKPGNVLVALQLGAEVGLHPMQAIQSIAVINGRPCMWGDAVLAIVQASGKLAWMEEEDDGQQATCTVQRIGAPKPVIRTFSMAEATAAQVYERDAQGQGRFIALAQRAVWRSYPKRMRQMRARAWALRDAFADVLKGVAVREEAADLVDPNAPEERDAAIDLMPRQRAIPEAVTEEDVAPTPAPEPRDAEQADAQVAPVDVDAAGAVTFDLNGRTVTTRGITKAQLLETFRLEAMLKKLKVGELVKTIGRKEFNVEHRTDLTAEQAERFIIRLKECAGEV